MLINDAFYWSVKGIGRRQGNALSKRTIDGALTVWFDRDLRNVFMSKMVAVQDCIKRESATK